MKYNADQIMQGIMNYADSEVINKLPTAGKWVVGTAIGLATTRANNVVDAIQTNAIAKAFGIVDENGLIDIDALMSAMKNSADRYGKISVEVPLIGKLSFSSADVDTLRNYIV